MASGRRSTFRIEFKDDFTDLTRIAIPEGGVDLTGFSRMRISVISGTPGTLYFQAKVLDSAGFVDIVSQPTAAANLFGAPVAGVNIAFLVVQIPASHSVRIGFDTGGVPIVGPFRLYGVAYTEE